MAALTYDHPLQYDNFSVRDTIPYVILNGSQIYVGDLVDCKTTAGEVMPHVATGGTANPIVGIADRGGVPGSNPILDGFSLGAGIGPGAGPSIGPGNVATAAAGNANKCVVETGQMIVRAVTLTVTGTLTGAITDIGMKLYCATSNIADSATTAVNSDKPLGKVANFLSYNATAGTAVYDIEVMSQTDRLQY